MTRLYSVSVRTNESSSNKSLEYRLVVGHADFYHRRLGRANTRLRQAANQRGVRGDEAAALPPPGQTRGAELTINGVDALSAGDQPGGGDACIGPSPQGGKLFG